MLKVILFAISVTTLSACAIGKEAHTNAALKECRHEVGVDERRACEQQVREERQARDEKERYSK